MRTQKSLKQRLLVGLIVFMIMFSNCGFTLSAIATSDGFQVITNGFFRKDEIKFNAYFEDENGNQTTEMTSNVNQRVRLILDILPQVQGYLKSANLKLVSGDNGNVNFKIVGMDYYQEESLEANLAVDVATDEKLNEGEKEVTGPVEEGVTDEMVESEIQEESAVEETNSSDNTIVDELSGQTAVSTDLAGTSSTADENVANEVSSDTAENTISNTVAENETSQNEVAGEIAENENTTAVEGTVSEEDNTVVAEEVPVVEETADDEIFVDEDALIDEEKVIEEITEEKIVEERLPFGMKILSNNEVEVLNIIKNTKIVLDVEYEMGETLNVEDLMKEIHIQLTGTYINSDLEEVAVAKEAIVNLGWEYTKDVSLTSEFTKFSPFEVGEITGTIVENKVTVEREITDDKFLPIKNTKLEVGVPKVNGKNPTEISVVAEKMLATRGEDTGNTVFNKDNWTYDIESGKVIISVENTNLVYAQGMDEYVIIYRYEDKIDAENSNLDKSVVLTVEEFSGSNNNFIRKEINDKQEIKVDVGELVTYNIYSSEEKINKSKIYANYNNETPIYETEFTNQVNVNILTTDILEELKINFDQEFYRDINGYEFAAEGIGYRRLKFNYSEITNLLVNGGEIVITNLEGEVLYTLNNEIIKSEDDCLVNLNEQSGIILYAKNIQKNGNLNFEVVKVIKGCNYDKSAFKNFTGIESKVTAEVKYQKVEESLSLPTISTIKYFEESSTYARIFVNKESLSTTKSNDNVEIKIELNNDKDNSDLYINPAFEIVFPKYVTDVQIQNLNILYENGLRAKEFTTYEKNGIIIVRVELEGTQKTFSESTITNGTNIILNVNIKVDEYTPKKDDIIKLYYCNEGVSTYESQTKWTISKSIPNGILKQTNGFDGAVISYQAPSGLIAINGIVNYDGMLSEIKSVKQGEVKQEIPVGSSSRIMTMELLALNNTDNKCTDVALLGRFPFEGAKDVVTNRDLGTTTNVVIKDLIREDITNSNTVDIYYSSNGDATRDLADGRNGWTKQVSSINEIKSFLIVVKGEMEAGQVLRYTYDFEIPENLPYESNIEGSFGAFYNNNTDIAIVYESSVADTVGLTTKVGPKVTAELTSNYKDGEAVLSNRDIEYTVKINNEGSEVANDVVVNVDIPKYTNYLKYEGRTSVGNYGYILDSSSDIQISVGTVSAGESKEVSFRLRTSNVPTLDEYAEKDENGYYIVTGFEEQEIEEDMVVDRVPVYDENENLIGEKEVTEKVTRTEYIPIKEYITEVPDVYVIAKAKVNTSLLANPIETNEIKNKLEQANFKSEIRIDYDRVMTAGMSTEFELYLTNTARKDLMNVVAFLNIGDIYNYRSGMLEINDENIANDDNLKVNESEGRIYFYIGDMAENETVRLETYLDAKLLEDYVKTVDCYFEFYADDVDHETSTVIPQTVTKSYLTASDMTLNFPTTINENGTFTVSTLITNMSSTDCSGARLEIKFPEALTLVSVEVAGGSTLSVSNIDGSHYVSLPLIYGEQSVTVDISFKTNNLPGSTDTKAIIERIIHNDNQADVKVENMELTIKNNEKTAEELEQERAEKEQQQYEQNKANSNNSSNNSNNSNNNSSNSSNNSNNSNNANNSNNSNNNSSNSSNNSNSSNKTNNSNSSNSSNSSNNSNNTATETYTIEGISWIDTNRNGVREDSEPGLSGIKVYLLTTANNMLKSTVTDKNGSYKFTNVQNGKYVVAVSYDSEKYMATTYKQAGMGEDRTSSIIENESGDISALTNEINVENSNVSSINIGLQTRNVFDLTVNKYLSKIHVTNGKYNETYEYDNEEIAKVEIHSKQINGAKVDLEYTIVVENIGDIEGYAEELVDYIDNEVIFEEANNPDWFIGNDGYAYAKNLNQKLLRKGEKVELKLVLSKIMNEDNTGTLTNTIELLKAYNVNYESENKDNNASIQNTLILISTGSTTQIIIMISILLVIAFIVYINRNNLMIRKKGFFKEKTKNHVKIKKVYK